MRAYKPCLKPKLNFTTSRPKSVNYRVWPSDLSPKEWICPPSLTAASRFKIHRVTALVNQDLEFSFITSLSRAAPITAFGRNGYPICPASVSCSIMDIALNINHGNQHRRHTLVFQGQRNRKCRCTAPLHFL